MLDGHIPAGHQRIKMMLIKAARKIKQYPYRYTCHKKVLHFVGVHKREMHPILGAVSSSEAVHIEVPDCVSSRVKDGQTV